jgi:hypothetical protein
MQEGQMIQKTGVPLSFYTDNELAFLLDAMTQFIEQTREESKRLRSESAKITSIK